MRSAFWIIGKIVVLAGAVLLLSAAAGPAFAIDGPRDTGGLCPCEPLCCPDDPEVIPADLPVPDGFLKVIPTGIRILLPLAL